MDVLGNLTNVKSIKFIWNSSLHSTEITINIPDFSNSKYQVSGDWGPMYKIDIEPTHPINISYFDIISKNTDHYNLDEKSFELNSPMLAEERDVFPFYFKVLDKNKNLSFHLFTNKKSEVERIDIFRTDDNVKLYSSSVK